MALLEILLVLFVVCLIIGITGLVIIKLTSSCYPIMVEYPSESSYIDSQTGKKQYFPSIDDNASCTLSVIVPAYNEESRLPIMMDEATDYLESKTADSAFTYEIIIVDDGSKDKTTEIGNKYAKKYGSNKIRVLTLEVNRGKGGAVRLGMMRARGEVLLFADADGATKFSDYSKLHSCIYTVNSGVRNISESLSIVCGSRAHLEEASISERSYIRTVLMYGFHFLVWLFAVRGIKDTQCGFKLLTRRAARIVFKNLHIERWAFDVEMLYIAQYLKIPIKEVAVTWTEIEGSKVTPVLSWLEMGRDLILIWLRYAISAWKILVKE